MNGKKRGELLLTLFFLAFFVTLLLISMTYSPKARRMPLVVILPGVVLCTLVLVQTIKKQPVSDEQDDGSEKEQTEKHSGPQAKNERKKMLIMFGWMALLVAMIWTCGFLVTIPVYTILFMKSLKESWRLSIIFGVAGFIVLYFLFVVGLNMELYPGLLFQ